MVRIKRIYEPVTKDDGFRVLVDRLWPRGLSKETVHIDLWLKEIAPSAKLRKWFSHDHDKWVDFQKKYKSELKDKEDLVKQLKKLKKENKVVTLLYASKDEQCNQAVVLKDVLSD